MLNSILFHPFVIKPNIAFPENVQKLLTFQLMEAL